MTATVIDGKAFAAKVRAAVAAHVGRLKGEHGIVPGLAVVLVGDDPASAVYVRNKGRQTLEAGMRSEEHRLPATASEADVLALVARLNADPAVHGILVQLPLPPHLDSERVLARISPNKDVDGFHPINLGLLANRNAKPAAVPCTPAGCLELLLKSGTPVAGAEAVVIGRSTIVGMPMALLLNRHDATVTILHSKSKNFEQHLKRADIVVAAIGKPEWVKGSMLKPGSTVIDVGINRVDGKLVGDVEFDTAKSVAGAITPVPGGVGPMTIAMLLRNVVNLAQL